MHALLLGNGLKLQPITSRKVEKNPQFVQAVARTFQAVASDEKIRSIGLVESMDSPPPQIPIPRSTLIALASEEPQDSATRTITEQAELQIVKAILKKSNRKWEFVWRGVTISAPVTDQKFYVDFFAHEIKIAPGDTLDVTLAIKQTKDPDTGIFTNIAYEVVEVHEHKPRIKQMRLATEG